MLSFHLVEHVEQGLLAAHSDGLEVSAEVVHCGDAARAQTWHLRVVDGKQDARQLNVLGTYNVAVVQVPDLGKGGGSGSGWARRQQCG
jgi:hypothetical protein